MKSIIINKQQIYCYNSENKDSDPHHYFSYSSLLFFVLFSHNDNIFPMYEIFIITSFSDKLIKKVVKPIDYV